MILKDWTFRKKNRALYVLAGVLLLLSWLFAIRKTVNLMVDYGRLKNGLVEGEFAAQNSYQLMTKLTLQDSLMLKYAADSTIWVSGLFQEIGTVLSDQPVGVNFENKAVGSSQMAIDRELVLTGSFNQLQGALQKLEKYFFIKSVRANFENDQLKYFVRLSMLKI